MEMSIVLLAQVLVIFGLVGLAMFVYRSATALEKIFVTMGLVGAALLMFAR